MDDTGSTKSHTPSQAVLAALLYLADRAVPTGSDAAGSSAVASTQGITDRHREMLDAVEGALESQLPDAPQLVRSALAEVDAAIRSVRARAEAPSLSASKYDALRSEVLDQLRARSSKGAAVWPPTSQTAVQRFGSWNEALKAAGLATNRLGRAKGQLRFDAKAYDKAMSVFVADCESRGITATYKAYTEYAAEHKGEVPSAAAVRKFYGSWNTALAAVG